MLMQQAMLWGGRSAAWEAAQVAARFNETAGATSFANLAPAALPIIREGSPETDAVWSKWYSTALYCGPGGTNEAVKVADAPGLTFGDEWYIGAWVRPVSFSTFNPLFCKANFGSAQYEMYSDLRSVTGSTASTLQANFYHSGSSSNYLISASVSVSLANTYHIAFFKKNGVIYAGLDNSVVGSVSAPNVMNDTAAPLELFANATDSRFSDARANDWLVICGVCPVDPAAYAAPTGPFVEG